MIRHLCNLLLSFLPPSRLFRFRNFLLRLSRINIHISACFCGRSWIYGRGRLDIGADTWISPGAMIYTHVDATIVIGKCCDVGPGVAIITGSHVIGLASRRAGVGTALPVTINDGCWIGAMSTILGGVSIGEGAIVTEDVPPHTLVAGVPARVKRQLVQ